jgi:putative SOS response-associated peptidase YedK
VSASGWYECQKLDAKKKRPIHMRPAATPFALAGVYDVWKGTNGQAITSFAIVMTDAAPSVAQYHNRMPVFLFLVPQSFTRPASNVRL